jgi:hypothetical protein
METTRPSEITTSTAPGIIIAGVATAGNGNGHGGEQKGAGGGGGGSDGSAITVLAGSRPMALVIAGLAIFLINIGLAWWVTFSSNAIIGRPLLALHDGQPSAIAEALKQAPLAHPNAMFLLHRVVEAELYHRLIANKQMLLTVGMAMSFGMMAVGFALFVLGVQSAYSISGSAGPSTQAAITAASPGLLCFLLAAAIAIIALTRETNVGLSTFTVYPGVQNSNPTGSPPDDRPGKVDFNAIEQAMKNDPPAKPATK